MIRKIQLILTFLASHLILIGSAHAGENACRVVFSPMGPSAKIQVIAHKSNDPNAVLASPEMLTKINLLFGEMSDLVSGRMNVPDTLKIRVLRDSNPDPFARAFDGPAFLPDLMTARIPYRYYYGSSRWQDGKWIGQTKHPVHTRPIQIHELAHSIFGANSQISSVLSMQVRLKKQVAELRSQKKGGEAWKSVYAHWSLEQKRQAMELVQNRPVTEMLKIRADITKGRFDGSLPLATERQLLAEFNRLQVELRKQEDLYEDFLHRTLPPEIFSRWIEAMQFDGRIDAAIDSLESQLRTIRGIVTPYNELFADAFAVVMTKDPRAIHRAISYTVNAKRNQYRDFSARIPVSNLPREIGGPDQFEVQINNKYGQTAWKQSLSTPWGLNPQFEAHGVLDAARSYFWLRYASRPPLKSQPGLTMQTLFRALVREIDARATEPSLSAMSPHDMNERLIQAMDREFERVLENQ